MLRIGSLSWETVPFMQAWKTDVKIKMIMVMKSGKMRIKRGQDQFPKSRLT